MNQSRKASEGYNGCTKKLIKPESTFTLPVWAQRHELSNGDAVWYIHPRKMLGPTNEFQLYVREQEREMRSRQDEIPSGKFHNTGNT